jgi:hypothetical protein
MNEHIIIIAHDDNEGDNNSRTLVYFNLWLHNSFTLVSRDDEDFKTLHRVLLNIQE